MTPLFNHVATTVSVTAVAEAAPSIDMRRHRSGRSILATVVAIVSLLAAGHTLTRTSVDSGAPHAEASPSAPGIEGLRTVPARASVPGYDRSCGAGHACVFGPAWSDDVDVAGGHDGCDTRNQILHASMSAVTTKAGTHGCVVLTGTLKDPYSGTVVTFTKADAGQVAIDHVYPLAAAWDFGASSWTVQQRRNFANDPRNLLATTRAINSAKSDKTPQSWAPSSPEGRCLYASRYTAVATAYGLPAPSRTYRLSSATGPAADLAWATRVAEGLVNPSGTVWDPGSLGDALGDHPPAQPRGPGLAHRHLQPRSGVAR